MRGACVMSKKPINDIAPLQEYHTGRVRCRHRSCDITHREESQPRKLGYHTARSKSFPRPRPQLLELRQLTFRQLPSPHPQTLNTRVQGSKAQHSCKLHMCMHMACACGMCMLTVKVSDSPRTSNRVTRCHIPPPQACDAICAQTNPQTTANVVAFASQA